MKKPLCALANKEVEFAEKLQHFPFVSLTGLPVKRVIYILCIHE
jgi:hypothetical protein